MAASLSASLSHFDPLRVRPERRFPAEWSLPGHWPAQEARWPAVGNTDVSTPISARMFCAVRVSIPSTVRGEALEHVAVWVAEVAGRCRHPSVDVHDPPNHKPGGFEQMNDPERGP